MGSIKGQVLRLKREDLGFGFKGDVNESRKCKKAIGTYIESTKSQNKFDVRFFTLMH